VTPLSAAPSIDIKPRKAMEKHKEKEKAYLNHEGGMEEAQLGLKSVEMLFLPLAIDWFPFSSLDAKEYVYT
jgi:hypothetical protein